MNTRAIATEYRLAHWAGVMRERQESGLSIRAFCKQSGFHENIYFYWQRKLREAACTQLQQVTQVQTESALAPAGWSVCAVAEPEGNGNSSMAVEIGKFKVTVNNGDDMGLFTKVCKSLALLC